MRTFSILAIFWILVLVVLLGVLALGVAVWQGWFTFRPGEPPSSVMEPLDEPAIPMASVLYQPSRQWTADVPRPAAVAVDPKERIYVAGEKRLQVFDLEGRLLDQWELPHPARCLAVAGPEHLRPGFVYIGYPGQVEIRTDKGERVGAWPVPGERAEPTSIALGQKEIFVADASAKCVHRFDLEGKLLGQIGKPDPARGYPGLILPSPYCDVAIDKDGLVWVVNPGLRRLEAYRPVDGRLERFWGGPDLEGDASFFGCCNPANFCLLPDGRFVTAEKGLLRLKVYSSYGELRGWVIRPADWNRLVQADHSASSGLPSSQGVDRVEVADVAADSQGRIILLYMAKSTVYVFDPLPPPP